MLIKDKSTGKHRLDLTSMLSVLSVLSDEVFLQTWLVGIGKVMRMVLFSAS